MICQKCNFQNTETAKFCRNCGEKLTVIFAFEQQQPTITQNSLNLLKKVRKRNRRLIWIILILFGGLTLAIVLTEVLRPTFDINENEELRKSIQDQWIKDINERNNQK
jgi:uncharacterized membrane protein YvbJ